MRWVILMKKLSVLMPYRSDNGPRERTFRWVKMFYEKMMPEAEICVSDCSTELFSRAEAINNAAKLATGDVFIITDTDIVCDPKILRRSINLLNEHAWIIPFNRINHLSVESTNSLVNTAPSWPSLIPLEYTKKVGAKRFKGGLNVISRKNFETVKGFDERFIGYGAEDDAFSYSVNILCGRYFRPNTEIFHLWHPRVIPSSNPNYEANCELLHRYYLASKSKKKMKQIIDGRLWK